MKILIGLNSENSDKGGEGKQNGRRNKESATDQRRTGGKINTNIFIG